MKITTRAVYQMTDTDGEYIPLESESYEYSGPIELAQGCDPTDESCGLQTSLTPTQIVALPIGDSAGLPIYPVVYGSSTGSGVTSPIVNTNDGAGGFSSILASITGVGSSVASALTKSGAFGTAAQATALNPTGAAFGGSGTIVLILAGVVLVVLVIAFSGKVRPA